MYAVRIRMSSPSKDDATNSPQIRAYFMKICSSIYEMNVTSKIRYSVVCKQKMTNFSSKPFWSKRGNTEHIQPLTVHTASTAFCVYSVL